MEADMEEQSDHTIVDLLKQGTEVSLLMGYASSV